MVAGSVVLLHYSRIPEYLEPVGWGTLGLWAFLRGLRTRDAFALAASGLLNRQLGGPSVKPYQPAGLWEATGKSYTPDTGSL